MKTKLITIHLIIICWLMPMLYRGDHLAASCVNGTACFRSPKDCVSSKTCDFLLIFKYNESSQEVTFSLGSKHGWVAFGLRKHALFLMDKLQGKICMKNSSYASLKSFTNDGYSSSFAPTVGVKDVVTKSIDGSIICSYSRPILHTLEMNLVNLDENLYVIASYGSMRGASPRKHKKNAYAISASSVNFRSTTSLPIDLGEKYNSLVSVHGSCMSLSWFVFITIGIFAYRYSDFINFPILEGWCQLPFFMIIIAILLMCSGMLMIFGFKQGWKPEGSDGHAYVGLTSIGFVFLYQCLNLMTVKFGRFRCNLFRIMHAFVGACVLGSGAAAVLTGYTLLNVNQITAQIWVCVMLLSFCISELYLRGKRNVNVIAHADTTEADNAEQIAEATEHRNKQVTNAITCITVVVITVDVILAVISIAYDIKEGITRK